MVSQSIHASATSQDNAIVRLAQVLLAFFLPAREPGSSFSFVAQSKPKRPHYIGAVLSIRGLESTGSFTVSCANLSYGDTIRSQRRLIPLLGAF